MVMNLEVTFSGQLLVVPEYEAEVFDHDEEVEKAFDVTMAELVKLSVKDPALSGSITIGEFEVTVGVEANSFPEAIAEVDSAIRSALHAANVRTPDWESQSGLRVVWHKVEAEEEEADDPLVPA